MSVVEMQPATLPSSFPLSDTRPSRPNTFLQSQYLGSRQSSKENKTPPSEGEREGIDRDHSTSPQSLVDHRSSVDGQKHTREDLSPQAVVAGKKRSANGQVKEKEATDQDISQLTDAGHLKKYNNRSNRNSANLTEVSIVSLQSLAKRTDGDQLSQQLRTRLTYAMVKLQNGWQDRSLDEIESLASHSPRSTTFNHYSDNSYLLSPRVAMTAHLQRQNSSSSSDSDLLFAQHPTLASELTNPPNPQRGLAPPANIISRPPQQRRRPPPNMQVHTEANPVSRPTIAQRTPSQSAAMEADAVETLLFMASPNHSGRASSRFSPVASAPSVNNVTSQTSPLRSTFSLPTSPKRVAFSSHINYSTLDRQSKEAILTSMVERLDDDGSAELDEALKTIDRHHAMKETT